MKNKDKFARNLIWILISFQTILTGIFFVVQVLRIYLGRVDGEEIFTREKVGQYLLQILVLIIIWVLVVVVGIIMSFIKKMDYNIKAKNSNIVKLKAITCILPYDKIEETDEDYILLKSYDKNRKIAYLIFSMICLGLAVFPFMYLFNPNHFVANGHATRQVIDMILHILPFVVIGFVCFIATVLYENYSANNSIIVAKKLLAKYKKGEISFKAENKRKVQLLWAIRGLIIAIGIVFIITGIINGGPSRVYAKAAKICSECIGLG